MIVQTYIQSRLEALGPFRNDCSIPQSEISEEIVRLLLSKKFRKYSANDAMKTHCREAVEICVRENRPINITFVHGAYKLWRLEEAPEVDWAELFALMYYTKWMKAICEIYPPGVHFDFFVDDYIVPDLDNIPIEDVEKYVISYQNLLDFLKPYQPENLQMTITTVGSQFDSREIFRKKLFDQQEKMSIESKGVFSELTPAQRSMIELNVHLTKEQEKDPKWRETTWQLHNAYLVIKREAGYHIRPDKILAFTQPLASGATLSVGTTKSSVAKFWVGVGVLRKKSAGLFQEAVLTPKQLDAVEWHWQQVSIRGLSGKNFERIRVID